MDGRAEAVSLRFAFIQMRVVGISLFVAAALLLLVQPVWAAEGGEEFDPVHHVADGYYLDLEPFGKLELPRIFLVRRNDGSFDLEAFLSTSAALRSGRFLVEADPENAEDTVLGASPTEPFEVREEDVRVGSPAEHAETLFVGSMYLESELVPANGSILIDFSVSRHLVFAILGALVVLVVFTRLAGRYRRGVGRDTAPRGVFQNMMETLIVFVRDEIAKPNLGDRYERYLPYLLTAFFFILTCNLMGLVPFGATATSNLMVTAVLAGITFAMTQFSGSRDHWRHIFWPPGVPTFVKPILIPVEILGLFTKPIALAIRLFANMTAGHLVILSLIGLIFSFTQMFGDGVGWGVTPVSLAFSLFIYLLELLVSFIQAYIFTMLSALFIGMAMAEHPHTHEDEHAQGELTEADHAHVTPHYFSADGGMPTPRAAEAVAAQ